MGAEISIQALPDHERSVLIDSIDDNPIACYLATEPDKRKVNKKYAVVREYRIYTVGQGILIESRGSACGTCTFKDRLALGSWYDIEVCVEGFNGDGTSQTYSFLTCGVYCTATPPVLYLSDLLLQDKLLAHSPWTCTNKACNHVNYSSVPICKGCNTHSMVETFYQLAAVPVLGIPFGITIAVLTCGKACVTKKPDDIVEASTETALVIVHCALAPFLVKDILICICRHVPVNGVRSVAHLLAIYPYQKAYNEMKKLTAAHGINIEMARNLLNHLLTLVQPNLAAQLLSSQGLARGAPYALCMSGALSVPSALRLPTPQVSVALRTPATQIVVVDNDTNADDPEQCS